MIPFRRSEKWLMGFGAVLFLLGAYLSNLGSDRIIAFLGLGVKNGSLKLAEAKMIRQSVKRKQLAMPEFSNLRLHAPIFNNDFIATGDDSGALIEFLDGANIELGPNALIQIQKWQNAPLLAQNEITLSVEEGEVKVLVPSSHVSVIKTSGKHPEFLKKKRANPTPTLSSTSTSTSTPAPTPKVLITKPVLKFPAMDQVFDLKTQDSILFTWIAISDDGGLVQFELSKDPSFRKKNHVMKTNLNYLKYMPESAGTYYWRIIDLKTRGTSLVSRFKLK